MQNLLSAVDAGGASNYLNFWEAVVQIVPVLGLALVVESRLRSVMGAVEGRGARRRQSYKYRTHLALGFALAFMMVGVELVGLLYIAIPKPTSYEESLIELGSVVFAIITVIVALFQVVTNPMMRRLTEPESVAPPEV